MAGWDDDWQRGDVLGDYELVAKLGEGGMSRVYEGRHRALGSRVAIKTLRPEHRANATIRARFEREGVATARIHHPHVVKVITVGTHRESPYLVMEFLTGKDLSRFLDERGEMGQHEALELLMPVLSALQVAHEEGLVHRDLKPANIMLEEGSDGRTRPVVVDFGIARLVDGPADRLKTRGSALLGTPAYMAPEQTRGTREVSPLSDQYALAVILYECLAGAPAFEGATILDLLTRVAAGRCVPLRVRRPDLPDAMIAAIERAMSVDPNARFASVRELALDLLPHCDDVTRAHWTKSFTTVRVRASVEPDTQPDAGFSPEHSMSSRNGTTLGSAARSVDAAPLEEPPVRSRRGMLVAGIIATMLLATSAGVALRRREPRSAAYAAEVNVTPSTARITIDGNVVGLGHWRGELVADGRTHHMLAEADGFIGEDVTFVNAPPPSVLRLQLRGVAPIAAPTAAPTPSVTVAPVAVAARVPAAIPRVEPERNNGRHRGHAQPAQPSAGVTAPAPEHTAPAPARPAETPQHDPCIGPNGTNLCI